MSEDGPAFYLRAHTPKELPFVRDSYIKSYVRSWFGVPKISDIPLQMLRPWNREQFAAITDTIASPDGRLVIAAAQEEPELMLGWVLWREDQPRRLWYVYVRAGFRNHGIGTALVERALGPDFTYEPEHKTEAWENFSRNLKIRALQARQRGDRRNAAAKV